MKIIAGNSNKPLAEEVCRYLNMQLTMASFRCFSDREIFVEIQENVRGQDVFILQSTSFPANDHLMELMIAIDALRRGSAKRITAVIPYFGYARQDRKTGPRTPISAKLVANMLTSAGAHRVLTLDLHSAQIQGFFDVPTDNLYSAPFLVRDIKARFVEKEIVIVSPDVGGVVRARSYAGRLHADLAIIDKRRPQAGVSEVMNIIGEVSKKHCILVDDIIDSGGTICNAATALLEKGAKSVSAYVTHGVLSGDAVQKIQKSKLENLIVTNSIQATQAMADSTKIKQLSIAPLMAEAINRISNEQSVSSLFD